MGKAGATMNWWRRDDGNEVSPFSFLSPYSSFLHSWSWHGDNEGKSEW
jgi:hypothetical protein